jgi:hypothetical protein
LRPDVAALHLAVVHHHLAIHHHDDGWPQRAGWASGFISSVTVCMREGSLIWTTRMLPFGATIAAIS